MSKVADMFRWPSVLIETLGFIETQLSSRFLFSAGQNDVCDNSNAHIIVNWSLQSMKLLGHPVLHFGEHLKNELPLPTFTPLKEWGKEILYIVEKDKKTSCLNYYCSEKMYLCVLMWIFGRSCFMVILSSVPWPRLVIAYSASPSANWYFWPCTMVRYQEQNPN